MPLNRQKRALRQSIRECVSLLPADDKLHRSRAIAEQALSLPETAGASHILLYYPLPDEVDTRPLMNHLFKARKTLYLPTTDEGEGITPVRILPDDLEDLTTGHLDIPVPRTLRPVMPEVIDLVVVPGRAFDRDLNRLGRGGGFYDRFLCQTGPEAVMMAVAFACQIVDRVPSGPHDMPVDIVVTENEVIRTG